MSHTSSTLESFFPAAADVPANHRLPGVLEQREILINGKMVPFSGAMQDVYSPVFTKDADGNLVQTLVGRYPIGTEDLAQQALDAAVAAYDGGRGAWPTMGVAGRIAALEHFTRLMTGKRDEVVRLIMWEIGKSYADSAKEFDRTVTYIHDTIDALKGMDREGSRFEIVEGIIAQIRRAPLGVVLCMGPFNYPLNETFCLLIPGLLMGNTVLFKTPKHGTLLHYPLLECFAQAFPPGVVYTIYGRGAAIVPNLMASGKVDVLSLIGSSKVADSLKKLHPKSNRLRAILGLDAKNVGIVLPCANIDEAIKECVTGALTFNGQRCTALKILYVHRSIADVFVQKLTAAVANLKVGMPWEDKVNITPLPEPGKPAYLADVIADAVAKGAKVVNPGGGVTSHSLVYPAILYPVAHGMKVYREEQFGPIIPIVPFDDIEEPITYMETSHHGQQVSIFGTTVDAISALIDPMTNLVCRVNVNAQCQRGPDVFPFTGRKDSAEGTLSVVDALRSFSIRTMVATKATAENKDIINHIVEKHQSTFVSTRYLL
jgi:acyl-CoA reductase-like NAD-dependent aldehyde dehydrogenase